MTVPHRAAVFIDREGRRAIVVAMHYNGAEGSMFEAEQPTVLGEPVDSPALGAMLLEALRTTEMRRAQSFRDRRKTVGDGFRRERRRAHGGDPAVPAGVARLSGSVPRDITGGAGTDHSMGYDFEGVEREIALLEGDIAAALERYAPGAIRETKLAPWSDVSDLSANVDVEVSTQEEPGQEYSVVTLAMLTRLLTGSPNEPGSDVYTSGDRLIVVREMTADAIARGILNYLGLRTP